MIGERKRFGKISEIAEQHIWAILAFRKITIDPIQKNKKRPYTVVEQHSWKRTVDFIGTNRLIESIKIALTGTIQHLFRIQNQLVQLPIGDN